MPVPPNQDTGIERSHVQAVIAVGKQADVLPDVAGDGYGHGCGLAGHPERIRDSGCDGTMSAIPPEPDINPNGHSGPSLAPEACPTPADKRKAPQAARTTGVRQPFYNRRHSVLQPCGEKRSTQLVEKRLRFLEIGGVEALSEPVLNEGEEIAGFGGLIPRLADNDS